MSNIIDSDLYLYFNDVLLKTPEKPQIISLFNNYVIINLILNLFLFQVLIYQYKYIQEEIKMKCS